MFGNVLLGRSVHDRQEDYEHRIVPVQAPVHPSSIRLLAYWQNCRDQGGMRMGRDIPARAIAGLLAHAAVAEPVDDWADARLRFVGSGMTPHFGRDVGGALMSDLFGDNRGELAMLLAGTRRAIVSERPGIVDHIVRRDGLEIMHHEMIVLPVRAPQGDAMWALTGTFAF